MWDEAISNLFRHSREGGNQVFPLTISHSMDIIMSLNFLSFFLHYDFKRVLFFKLNNFKFRFFKLNVVYYVDGVDDTYGSACVIKNIM
jgi:hypothetical protein